MINHVVSFSGGKDSTAMLFMMLERGMQIDRVVFIDTKKEFPQMQEHIEKVQARISPLKIEKVEIDYDYWFSEHVLTKGKRKGSRGYGWATWRTRWCTALKIEAFITTVYSGHKYKPRSRGTSADTRNIIEYHGIAYDENHRTHKNSGWRVIKYPLVDWKVTEAQALDYCYKLGLDWSGLYEDFDRVSCWCCPFSRIKELRVLFWKYPDLWNKLHMMDKKAFNKFRADYSIEQLEEKFLKEGAL